MLYTLVRGIIPTRMGTRPVGSRFSIVFRDHPHAYGDKFFSIAVCVFNTGIIPTRMGTRISVQSGKVVMKEHPHAYGDKSLVAFNKSADYGSSPRVWGQDCFPTAEQIACRIIPTRMGTRGLAIATSLTL